jgi:hypothetical protein
LTVQVNGARPAYDPIEGPVSNGIAQLKHGVA